MNLGVNKDKAQNTESAAADYSLGVRKLGKYSDYIVINLSSPNTQGTGWGKKNGAPYSGTVLTHLPGMNVIIYGSHIDSMLNMWQSFGSNEDSE